MRILKRVSKRTKKYERGAKSFRWHHPFVIPVVTFMVLFFASVIAFIGFSGETVGAPDTKVVRLTVDGKEMTVPTRAHKVADLLKKLGLELTGNDAIEPSPKTPIVGDNFKIDIKHAKPYVVVDENGEKLYATVAGVDLKDAAKKAGAQVYFEDIVYAEPTTADETIDDGFVGTKLLINRATPVVVNLYGKSVVIRTHKQTVGEVLAEKGIVVRKKDKVQPSLDTRVKPNLGIFIFTKGKKIINIEEEIAPPVEQREDPESPLGTETVIEAGTPGVRIVTYELILKNGKEVGRKKIQSVITQQPKKRIVIVGTKFDGFDGSFGAALAALRSCEGSYTSNTGNGYYGAYQFNLGSWQSFAPAAYRNRAPSDAPPAVQDLAASNYYQASGWSPWPACSANLGLQDVYR
jgi:resuscitation-promoting factor RpfB